MKRRSKSKIFAGVAAQQVLAVAGTPVVLLVVSLIFIIVSSVQSSGVDGLRMQITDGVAPLISTVTKPFFAVVDFAGNVSGMAELRAENAKLETENVRLREWYQAALVLQSENQSLKELLNLKIEPHFQYISTRIIADAGNAFVKSVLAGAGQNDGVRKGQPVISGEGLVGRVVEAGNNSSRILLLTDYNSRVPVMIEGSRQRAILTGNNTDSPVIKHLPPDTAVEQGMRVITSGHGGLFPPGLAVGMIEQNEAGLYKVKLFADINRVTHIRILDTKVDPNLRRGQID